VDDDNTTFSSILVFFVVFGSVSVDVIVPFVGIGVLVPLVGVLRIGIDCFVGVVVVVCGRFEVFVLLFIS